MGILPCARGEYSPNRPAVDDDIRVAPDREMAERLPSLELAGGLDQRLGRHDRIARRLGHFLQPRRHVRPVAQRRVIEALARSHVADDGDAERHRDADADRGMVASYELAV